MMRFAETEQFEERRRQLDLLVDGELDADDRRQLLLSLDDEPDGWRQCAMAFLEAQAWGGELKSLSHEIDQGEATSVPDHRYGAAPARRLPRVLGSLAIAASFVAVFCLGMLLRGTWLEGAGSAQPEVAERDNLPAADASRGARVDLAAVPSPRRPHLPQPRRQDPRSETDPRFDHVQLVLQDGSGEQRMVEAPLVDLDDHPFAELFNALEDQWHSDPAMPRDALRQLEAMGHRVHRQRRLAPFQLDDGRQVVVPVEDVRIVPVGRAVN